VNACELEVVWPLHRWHYLSPMLADAGIDMNTEPESSTVPPAPARRPVATSRDLATRALQAGANCSQQRVSDLLAVSRRTLSRTVDPDVVAALHDADVVKQARTYLADTASRGSTAEEREAAAAWLVDARRDDQLVKPLHQRTSVRRPAAIRAGNRNGGGPVKRPATRGVFLRGGASRVRPGPALVGPRRWRPNRLREVIECARRHRLRKN
jgi:hypothetical protein